MSAKLFGKLPAHGDFVSRGMTPDARNRLDQWLAASLADARVAHGDRFDGRYEEAPPWRFASAVGDTWTAGAIALSMDAVGRRYPILLALDDLTGGQVEHAAELTENLLYDTLEVGWDADQLYRTAASTHAESGDRWAGGEGWWTLGGARFSKGCLVGARPAALLTVMLTPAEPMPDESTDKGAERPKDA